MYNLPLGIRIPKKDEYPKGYDVNEINKRRESANIVAGYKFNEINDEKYSYYVEINVDSEKLWEVFYTLSKNIISNTAYGIIAF